MYCTFMDRAEGALTPVTPSRYTLILMMFETTKLILNFIYIYIFKFY